MSTLSFERAQRGSTLGLWTRHAIETGHYLHCLPDPRTSYEAYVVRLGAEQCGALVFGRPESTRCADWYGAVADVQAGRCAVTRWQVLNLSRVWIHPDYQAGGANTWKVPGYTDRNGTWRSTLASVILTAAANFIRTDYLLHRPPCFLDEPYELRWLLSYCDSTQHRGTIYKAAGWELYRTNKAGLQTWRTPLPAITPAQDAAIRAVAATHPRSIRYRAQRAQLSLQV